MRNNRKTSDTAARGRSASAYGAGGRRGRNAKTRDRVDGAAGKAETTGGRRGGRAGSARDTGRAVKSATPPGAERVVEGAANVAEDYIAGRHPVLEALKAGRPANKLLVAEGAEGGSLTEILGKAKADGVIVQRVPRTKLEQIAGPHSQGVVLYVAPHKYAELEEITAKRTGQASLIVLLDEVEDPYNLGAVLRSAEATGASGVIIPKRRSVPLTGVVAKVAAGALEHVPVARVTNLVQTMEKLQKDGYWIVGADASATQLYTQVDYSGPVAIVIGAEGKGLSRLVRERCDHLVKLPMRGNLQSLNASVATGVLLYEVLRQRG